MFENLAQYDNQETQLFHNNLKLCDTATYLVAEIVSRYLEIGLPGSARSA